MRVLLLAVLLLAAAAPFAPAADEVCARPVPVEGVGRACARPDGLLDVVSSAGAYLGTVHGADPAPARPMTETHHYSPPPLAPACVPLGTPHSARVVHARPPGARPEFAVPAEAIVETVHTANAHLAASAAPFGVGVRLRVQCDGEGRVDVAVARLWTGERSFAAVVEDLRDLGFDDPEVKYWVWYEDVLPAAPCGGGVGHVHDDDRPGVENLHNGGSPLPMYAVTWSCRGVEGGLVMAHENGHNMGAVQLSAPHSTGAWHCTDGFDVMCYADDGAKGSQYQAGVCFDDVYDCGNDDYFHPAPQAGTYLATHWNVASADNLFVERSSCAWTARGTSHAGAGGRLADAVVPVPASCWGRPFGLAGTGYGPQDFDVCMGAGEAPMACWEEDGSDEGTIPEGATWARVRHDVGVLGRWRLLAS